MKKMNCTWKRCDTSLYKVQEGN